MLEVIADLQAAADRTRHQAEGEATRLVDAAGAEAEQAVRQADEAAPGARAAAAKKKHEAVDAEIERVVAAADEEAARIDGTSRERRSELVQEVASRVLSGGGLDL